MITDDLKQARTCLPFLFRFAKPIPHQTLSPLRYDSQRQISQILVEGEWIDTPDAPAEPMSTTRFTRTPRETTDDA
jgi:hypothetical protein